MGGGPPEFRPGFPCPALLGESAGRDKPFAYRAITFFGRPFQCRSARPSFVTPSPIRNSGRRPPRHRPWNACGLSARPVWALSLSLAATQEVEVSFFSCGYLDVSVPHVVLHSLWIQPWIPGHCPGWVAPFGNLRIIACSQLPEAYRSLPRPSSTLHAETSTMHPS